ncbi:MAG: hypothetical protein CVU05_04570 [Bacteroidetes bacterium HGW-Bacteroidetes-21]|jgi:hypothetical protein|nr:MAG: hypothetical protein CVU05_04570 [Bacteroidetes bacterium HGW-Bacteroidetes-21]
MSKTNQIKRVYQLIIHPNKEWEQILQDVSFHKKGFLLFSVLVVLSAISGVCGRYLYALNPPVLIDILPEAMASLIVPNILLYSCAVFIKNLSGRYTKASYANSIKLVGYSMIPYLVILVLILLVRDLYFFGLLGLYSIYIFWTGLSPMLNFTGAKRTGRVVVVAMLFLLVFFFSELLVRFVVVKIIG